MTSPRWTYSEANASRWRVVFDSFITAERREYEIPLAGNARSLCSLKIRIGDALKYLADQFALTGNVAYKNYAELKSMLVFAGGENGLVLKLRRRAALVQPEDYKPLNLDAETVNRLIAMSQDQQYSLADRLLFAETVRVEREVQNSNVSKSDSATPSLVPSVPCPVTDNY